MSCSSLFFLYIAELGICHKIHVWLQQRPQQQMYLFLITPSTLLNQVCVIVVAINLLIYWEGNTALCWCLLGRKYYTYCCILLGKNHSLTRLWHTIEKDIHINYNTFVVDNNTISTQHMEHKMLTLVWNRTVYACISKSGLV